MVKNSSHCISYSDLGSSLALQCSTSQCWSEYCFCFWLFSESPKSTEFQLWHYCTGWQTPALRFSRDVPQTTCVLLSISCLFAKSCLTVPHLKYITCSLKIAFFLSRQLPLLSQGNNVFFSIWKCLCKTANWKEKGTSNSFYIKIWFAVVKETEKTCSAAAEKELISWITPCPRQITSPVVAQSNWATTGCVLQEAECHFHSDVSVWMRIYHWW